VIRLCSLGRSPVSSLACAVALTAGVATSVHASQAQVHVVRGPEVLAGELDGTSVSSDGVVSVGPEQKAMIATLPGAVLGLARAGDGQLYVATGNPGRVVRVEGSAGVELLASERALVTAVLPVGKTTLVALTAPDGGAEVVNLTTKAKTIIKAPAAKLLLAGAVVDDVVYAVGGGDDGGVVLALSPGKTGFEVIAKTPQSLRSVAAAKVGGKVQLVCGSADEGIVYAVDVAAAADKRVRALIDAAPAEVSAVAVDADGTVFAALIDGDGKLSKLASSKAKDGGDDDDDAKSKKPKARKVKGGEVWRIASDGSARVVFSSKTHGPYAIAKDGDRVVVGTGPEGRLWSLKSDGTGRPAVLARRSGNDEITALLVEGSGVVAGMSHAGGVVFFGKGQAKGATYLSPVLDADGRARYGRAIVDVKKGSARVALRTGNTKEPDETWSPWSTAVAASTAGAALAGAPAPYAQLKVDLGDGALITGVSLAYLVDNRAPEIDHIDVLAAGWKVVANPREPPEMRSVTFNEKPFAKFLDRRGAMNPTLHERPYGKQSFDVGYRTVYAYAEDADKDALRYRFSLGEQKADGAVSSWTLLQDWSEAPFVSFEASRLKDATYQVKVEIDDSLTNGPTRARGDMLVSSPFVVTHKVPAVTSTSATKAKDGVRVQLSVAAATPLISVRCATGLNDWLPLDPKDGILDAADESFDVVLPNATATSASCEVYDEALNFSRVDIPVR
jgi:hypothetical protein